jgi:transcriptional regulator with XRE-family HTH domain
MTQSDLARELNISKSAVSQNLNGKSTFDIQNLMHIAELFDVSLDLLLNMKSDEDRNVISEYERLVRKGYEAISEAAVDKLNVAVPDLYGKVLVEYVMEYDKQDIFEYLVLHGIRLFEHHQSNARVVQLEIIAYMIEHGMNGFRSYLHDYVRQYGSFEIPDDPLEERIIRGLDAYGDQSAIQLLFSQEVSQEVTLLKHLKRIRTFPILPDKGWARRIGKYHATELLNHLLHHSDIVHYIDSALHSFLQYGFFDGIEIVLGHLSDVDVDRIRKKPSLAQDLIMLVSTSKKDSLFRTMVEKQLYNDLTKLVIRLIEDDNERLYRHLIDDHPDRLDFRQIGVRVAALGHEALLRHIRVRLTPDDLDHIFATTSVDALAIHLVLLKLGARMNARYLNKDTTDKVNGLFTHLIDKGDQ